MTEGMIETEKGCIDWEEMADSYINEDGEEVEGDTYVRINNLTVKEEFQNNGVARSLLEKAVKLIREGFDGQIKIVACPKADYVDIERLAEFYDEYCDEVIPTAN